MVPIEQIIRMMTDDERSGFQNTLKSMKNQKYLLILFEKLSEPKEWKKNELSTLVYGKNSKGAYHSLRKRLARRLIGYISYIRQETDRTEGGSALSMFNTAQFFMERSGASEARQYLSKAETAALNVDQYDTLNMIYNFQLVHHVTLKIELGTLIKKLNTNTEAVLQNSKLNIAFAEIQDAHDKMKESGENLEAETVLNRVFNDEALMKIAKNNAAFMYRIASLCRTVIISAKDYHMFEPYIIGVYDHLKSQNAFLRHHQKFEIQFEYMIVHALYRTLKFEEAKVWLEKLYKLLPEGRQTSHELYPKYISTIAAVQTYTGNVHEAIKILNDQLSNEKLRIPIKERLNMQLNLSVYYFSSANYRDANRAIMKIHHSPAWLDSVMGKEWRFKRDAIEVIIYAERGESELALTRIASMKKNYGAFFKNKNYLFAGMFLNFIGQIIQNPAIAETEEFLSQIKEAAAKGWPGERNDIQAITFFCWIKCKIEKRDYYEVLVEVIKASASPVGERRVV